MQAFCQPCCMASQRYRGVGHLKGGGKYMNTVTNPWADNPEHKTIPLNIRRCDLPDYKKEALSPNDAIMDFASELEAFGLKLTGLPELSGTIVRVPTQDDKRGKKTGWYILYDGPILAGSFGDFRAGDTGNTWSSIEKSSMSSSQLVDYQNTIREARLRREAELLVLQKEAAHEAYNIYMDGIPVADFKYLVNKKLDGTAMISTSEEYYLGWMMLPLHDEAGDIVSLQFISETGQKYFFTNGRIQGCYNLVKGETDEIYIAEGYATARTVTEATGKMCAVAWNANNLMAVAENIRAKYPNSILIVAGDNDHETEIQGQLVNVGFNKADMVAKTLGLKAVFPVCEAGESDFNDILVNHGLDVVKLQLTNRIEGLSEPLPLRPPLPPSEAFPVDELGAIMTRAVKQIAFTIQVPVAIAAQSILANASLAVQGHYDVEMLHGDIKPTSMYFLSVLHSGGRKSASDTMAGKAIKEFEENSRNEYKTCFNNYLNRLDLWKVERNAILKNKNIKDKEFELDALGLEPSAPMKPVVTVPEPSAEALQKCLGLERPSMGLFSDEGGQFIGGYANSAEKQLATVTILSSIWDGSPIKRNRVLDGSSAFYGRRLAIHLMVQDGIANIMSGNEQFRSQGILARFLIAEPEPLIGKRYYRDVKNNFDNMKPYHDALTILLSKELPIVDDNDWQLTPEVLVISDEAKQELITFSDEIEGRQAPDKDLNFIADFASKLVEHAVRISAVIQVIEDPSSGQVSAENVKHGIALSRYYLSEAVRIRKGAVSADIQKAELLLEWLKDSWGDKNIYLSPIMNGGPNSIRLKKDLMKVISVLEDHKYLIRNDEALTIDGSIRKETWKINYR